MTSDLRSDINAMIFPAFAGTTLSDACKSFLDAGGLSILLAESREEYVARKMSAARCGSETAQTFHDVIGDAKARAGNLLVAVDQEIGGICRLHSLVPPFPEVSALPTMSAEALEDNAYQVGAAAAALGVNCFLAPVVDVVTGANPWLKGRTVSEDPEVVARVSAAYVRGVQRAGVAATAKHFPGFLNIVLDPAIEAGAIVTEPKEAFEPGFAPFRDVIAEDVEMIMVGPAITTAFDPARPALRSKPVVDMLKDDLGFKGAVMADGLTAKATMLGDPVEQVAIDAVAAGCDFLLLEDDGAYLMDVANALIQAAERGDLQPEAIARSAAKMRALAQKYSKP